jgi:hypothetical protein
MLVGHGGVTDACLVQGAVYLRVVPVDAIGSDEVTPTVCYASLSGLLVRRAS